MAGACPRRCVNGERVLFDRLAYVRGRPQRGDIVLAVHPSRPGIRMVKRVVARSGDTVAIEGNRCWVNGERLGHLPGEPPGRRARAERWPGASTSWRATTWTSARTAGNWGRCGGADILARGGWCTGRSDAAWRVRFVPRRRERSNGDVPLLAVSRRSTPAAELVRIQARGDA